MSRKIGRNDPCPCGSGKKYKHCCLNKKTESIGTIWEVLHSQAPRVSVFAIMRSMQYNIENPETDAQLNECIRNCWTLGKVEQMETSDIVKRLDAMNLGFEIERFKEDAKRHISAIGLAEGYYIASPHVDADDDDFIMLATIVLWKRLVPERFNIEMIDDAIQEGYNHIQDNYKDALELWGRAWTIITSIVPSYITSVEEADEYLPEPLTQSIHNWSQSFEMQLANGGRDDIAFYYQRIRYCREFCAIFPDTRESILQNMYRAEAEAYAALGYIETADNLFAKLVERYPDDAWGYIGWGDIYRYYARDTNDPSGYERAEELYRLGLARCDTEADTIQDRLEWLEKDQS
ncbi:MAG: SEC-C metal-binding domain-containing protein [Euryarchaeota archaeon]|nr:SEC-C metal-binding domain-containing protein [Euryarchaeota archaeon]